MRFRLATRPPLLPLKAWFDITGDNLVSDILGLKSQICSRLPQLVDKNGTSISPAGISLFIVDFELLDDSSLEVIKEGDLVLISRKEDDPTRNKRKTTNAYVEATRKRRKTFNDLLNKKIKSSHAKKPLNSSSSEDESESSDSDSSTTSSSESSSSSSSSSTSSSSVSSSSSDSSSTSTSTSSSNPSVEVQSSKLLPSAKTLIRKPHNNPVAHRVPPGQGKPSTHGRNARRRIKRLYGKEQKKQEEVAIQAVSGDSVNAVPLGTQKNNDAKQLSSSQGDFHSQSVSPPAQQGSPVEVESMVTTLRNKNKKKGFKKAMTGVAPQKIIFTGGTPPESTSIPYSAVSATTVTPSAPTPRLVTPSEKQALGLLPSNMFVTSVEVEPESWNKKKGKQRSDYGKRIKEDEEMMVETVTETETILNYGEPEIDWALTDKNWDTMMALSDASSLKEGDLVGWKALAINPATFTPETLVHLGRIKTTNAESSSIVLEPIRRPGSDDIAFGSSSLMDETEDGMSKEESIQDEIYTFEDALKASWKLVNI